MLYNSNEIDFILDFVTNMGQFMNNNDVEQVN
jgi:hypothetical protein